MEKVSAKVKPVPLQHQLDLYDRMASRMKKSLDRTKKRLHNAELTLNLQPPADEPAEIKKWNDKIEELVYRRINLPFPTYYEVKKEADVKKFREAQQNPKKKKSSTISVQVNKFTPEEIVHSKKNAFGGPKAGEVLGKIENYKGND